LHLTKEQQAVVENRGGNLLVSAAAGSGKTRVLVERLFRYVTEEHCNVDDFLIITYTRAAAAELRGRIAEELSARLGQNPGDRHLQQQLYRIYRADIKTVDSFCSALLRENVHLLSREEGESLTVDFRVLEENEAQLLRRRALGQVLENFYQRLDEGDALLADTLGFGRSDIALEELVLTLYGKLQSHAYPRRWINRAASFWQQLPDSLDETPYGEILLDALRKKALHWNGILTAAVSDMAENAAVSKGYAAGFAQVALQLKELGENKDLKWDAACAWTLTFPRLGAVKDAAGGELKARMKTLWDLAKKEWKAQSALFSVSSADAMADLKAMSGAMVSLLRLTAEFDEAYSAEKLRRNVTDFSDQEHFAVQLLLTGEGEPTELCRRVGARYREIMVDEYQDTNEVQNCIFEALAAERHNLFTVGDVKQSIYRFRLADPTIFLRKYRAFTPYESAAEGEDRRILLSKNFRSREQVLAAANFVFTGILSEEMGDMAYGDEERLYCGADYYADHDGCAAEFHVLDMPSGADRFADSRPMAEARFVAEKIAKMIAEGYLVQDGKAMRPCRAADFAVLMRSPGPRLRHYARAFRERNLSCATQESEDFFAQMEVAVTFSLLQIIDNPRQDVPLISVLRSPVFGFTPDRLAVIRGKHTAGDFYDALLLDEGEDTRAFLAALGELRKAAKELQVHELLWRIYDTLHLRAVFGAMSAGSARRENLVAFYEYARGFELSGYKGLFAFVSHLRELLEKGEQPLAASEGGSESVQIMSIHKSKGLEFPVVILADLDKDFSRQDFQSGVLVHPECGLGPVFVDLKRHIRYPTAARLAVESLLRRESRSEELRVLYVAMTRAKEKLIMVSSMKGAGNRLTKLAAMAEYPVSPNAVGEAKSMAEWILMPLLCRAEAIPLLRYAGADESRCTIFPDGAWQVSLHDGAPYRTAPKVESVRFEETETAERGEEKFSSQLLTFTYPYAGATRLPTKITATQLKGRVKDAEVEDGAVKTYAPRPLERPAFLDGGRKLTAAEKGSATHAVMQYLPLDCADVDAFVAGLVADGRLSEQEGNAVEKKSIRAFLDSSLAAEMRGAKEIWREYRFFLLLDGEPYFGSAGKGEDVMLQGVVDCFFETGEGLTVVDFKTDRVKGEALRRRAEEYRAQVEAYSEALSRIFGKKVCRKVLYFFHTGETVELTKKS